MIDRNLSVGYLVNNLEFDLKGEFLVGVFWTPNEFLLFHSLTIFKKFFVNLFQEYALSNIAANGLRIGDGGAFEKHQPNICTNAQ